jgi:hypothetical protein
MDRLMGWIGESMKITALLDAHGGERETEHARLWGEMVTAVRQVVTDPAYAGLQPELYADTED